MKIIFWQNIPSFHQSATIRALAAMPGCEVTLVFQENLSQTLEDGGWFVPDFGKTRLLHLKDADDIRKLILDSGGDAIHIFSGIRFPLVRKAFLAAMQTNARIGILAEAADWRGVKGLARFLLYRYEFLRFRSKINFVLAMGQLGVRWYSLCGIPAEKIYPYAYAVEKLPLKTPVLPSTETFRLIYVGRFIRLKGLDVLLSALVAHQSLDWHLDLVGDGPELNIFMRKVERMGLKDKVTFHGALRNDIARQMIAQANCLILPSHKDGWGAVVNEALMQGVSVICSDACGAADLLGDAERGEIFKAGSVSELESVLGRWIRNRERTRESIERIKAWSKAIEGETLAQYLLDVIAAAGLNERPCVPWRNGGKPCV